MATHHQTYKGFIIKANAKVVGAGFIPGGTVCRLADLTSEVYEVRAPDLVCATAKSALKEAILWARDHVDGLTEGLASCKMP